MSIQDCLASAREQGHISADEEDALLARLKEMERERLGGAQTKATLEKELRAEALEKERVRLLQASAQDRIAQTIRRDAERSGTLGKAPDIVRSLYGIFENIGSTGQQSIRGRMDALVGAAHAEMSDMLRAFRRSALTMRRFNAPMLDDLARAAFRENVSEEAQAFYKSFLTAAEKLRARFNEAGGHIAWRDDWGLPMFHSAEAIANANFERWRDFIAPRLDWEKMAHSVSGTSILEAEREGVLRHVFESIVMDGWNKREPSRTGAAGGGAALYKRRSDPRFLVFKDADAWTSYNQAFGSGDVFQTMTRHVTTLARDVAAMEIMGPNPNATAHWMKQLVASEAAKARGGQPSLFKRAGGANRLASHEAQTTIDGFMDLARGSRAPSSPIGDFFAAFRAEQYGAKLGSASISDALVNPIVLMGAQKMHGFDAIQSLPHIISNLTDRTELNQAGLIMGHAVQTLGQGAREAGAMRKLREYANWLPSVTMHYNGSEALIEAQRATAFQSQIGKWATMLGRELKDLPPALRETFEGNGLTAADWAIMRKARPHEPAKGAPFLRFQDIAAVGGREAEQTAMKYLTMLYQVNEAMVPSSNWRIRAWAARFGAEGTAVGEAWRSISMFKAGYVSTFMMTQIQMMQRATAAGPGGAAYVGAMTIGLALAGMADLQMRQARSGKDFQNMDPKTPDGAKTWGHAMLQSGGLGLLGDFLKAETSSYGHGFWASLGGPVVTGLEDVAAGVGRSALWAYGAATGQPAKTNPGADVVKMLRNNTPVLSTHWAFQAAYNRVVLDQLQFLADPKAHAAMRRRERQLHKDTGQSYWWRPGMPMPDRAPDFAGPK